MRVLTAPRTPRTITAAMSAEDEASVAIATTVTPGAADAARLGKQTAAAGARQALEARWASSSAASEPARSAACASFTTVAFCKLGGSGVASRDHVHGLLACGASHAPTIWRARLLPKGHSSFSWQSDVSAQTARYRHRPDHHNFCQEEMMQQSHLIRR